MEITLLSNLRRHDVNTPVRVRIVRNGTFEAYRTTEQFNMLDMVLANEEVSFFLYSTILAQTQSAQSDVACSIVLYNLHSIHALQNNFFLTCVCTRFHMRLIYNEYTISYT
jgi:hypothetical protein